MPEIDEYYERYWASPADYLDPTTPLRIKLLERTVGNLIKPNSKILDVGCGRGEFVELFASKGACAEGSDISSNCIEFARAKYPKLTFHRCSVETLVSERAASFDLVFSSEVIEHLFDVATYLHAINRLLKPGGVLVLTTPYHGILKNILISATRYAKHYDPLGQHIRFFNQTSLQFCLETFGFQPIVWTGYGRIWPFWKSFFVVSRKVAESQMPDPVLIGGMG